MRRKKLKHLNIYLEMEGLINKARVIVLSSHSNVLFEMDVVELSKVKFFMFI